MVLKLSEFKKNPLDYSQYNKPNKQIKEEFQFERLKSSYINGTLTLSDYIYAVGANLPIIEYIPEWLHTMNEKEIDINSLYIDQRSEEIRLEIETFFN